MTSVNPPSILPTVDPMTSSRTDFLNSEILAYVPGGHHCVSQGIVGTNPESSIQLDSSDLDKPEQDDGC